MSDDPDHELILDEAAHGRPLHAIAESRDMTIDGVRKILDNEATRAFSGEQLRRDMLIEARRLRELLQKFFGSAKAGDTASAAIYTKLSERLSTMLGMNAPQSHAVTIATAAAPPPETSTQFYRRTLDNVLGITFRERELIDRHDLDGNNDPALIAELNELRAARGKPPLAEVASAED